MKALFVVTISLLLWGCGAGDSWSIQTHGVGFAHSDRFINEVSVSTGFQIHSDIPITLKEERLISISAATTTAAGKQFACLVGELERGAPIGIPGVSPVSRGSFLFVSLSSGSENGDRLPEDGIVVSGHLATGELEYVQEQAVPDFPTVIERIPAAIILLIVTSEKDSVVMMAGLNIELWRESELWRER